eukprot:gene13848-19771_t
MAPMVTSRGRSPIFKRDRDGCGGGGDGWKQARTDGGGERGGRGRGGRGGGRGGGGDTRDGAEWILESEKRNDAFDEYYKGQKIVPEAEWEEFLTCLRKPLPVTFRINGTGRFADHLRDRLKTDFFSQFKGTEFMLLEPRAIDPRSAGQAADRAALDPKPPCTGAEWRVVSPAGRNPQKETPKGYSGGPPELSGTRWPGIRGTAGASEHTKGRWYDTRAAWRRSFLTRGLSYPLPRGRFATHDHIEIVFWLLTPASSLKRRYPLIRKRSRLPAGDP